MDPLKRPPALFAAPPRLFGYVDRKEAERARDKARAQGDALRPLYWSKRWRELRHVIIARDGNTCRQTGVLLIGGRGAPNSAVVDHIRPHRGDLALFWDEDNLQAVSKEYHDGAKQRLDNAGADQAQGRGGANR